MASGADAARDADARLDAQLAKSSKDAAARTSKRTQNASLEIAELERRRNEQIAAAKTDKEKIKIESEFLAQKKAITDATKDEVKADIQKVNARKQGFKQQLEELQKLQSEYNKTGDAEVFVKLTRKADEVGKQLKITGDKAFGFLESNATASQVVAQLTANIQGNNARLREYYNELNSVDEATKDLTSELEVEGSNFESTTKEIKEKTKAVEAYKVALIELDEVVRDLFDPDKVEQTLALEDERAITVANIAVLEAEIALKKAQQVGDTKAILEAEKALTKAKIEAINAQLKVDLKNELDPAKRKELELKAENDILGLGSVEKMKDSADEAFKIAQEFQEAITQMLIDQIDKRIELSKKEQDAAKSQQDYLEELAANGNITAQQSIAESIERQREAQAEQMRLE
jgi:hypothetical protein